MANEDVALSGVEGLPEGLAEGVVEGDEVMGVEVAEANGGGCGGGEVVGGGDVGVGGGYGEGCEDVGGGREGLHEVWLVGVAWGP